MDSPIHFVTISIELSILYFKGLLVKISMKWSIISSWRLFSSQQTVLTLMKCCLMQHFIWVFTGCQATLQCPLVYREGGLWHSGRVLDSRQRSLASSSLTGVTVLCTWLRHINPSFVLVQIMKTCPDITRILLTGNKTEIFVYFNLCYCLQGLWKQSRSWHYTKSY